jgi:hypothetical protein
VGGGHLAATACKAAQYTIFRRGDKRAAPEKTPLCAFQAALDGKADKGSLKAPAAG